MALRNLEKLKSTLIVVPPMGELQFSLNPAEVAKLLREPSIQSPGPNGITITSVRDQIVIRLSGRLEFEDQSDAPAGRLPEVAHGMLRLLGLTEIRAYGLNYEVTFDAPGDAVAAAFIKQTYVNEKALSERLQSTSSGAALQLFFDQGTARCRLRLEAKNQDLNSPQFFSHINYHYELDSLQSLPSLEDLRVAYGGLWSSYQQLLERMVRP